MPFSGNNFVRNQNFVSDRNAGPPSNTISAEKVDNEFDNLTAGLTTVKTAHETQKSLFPSPAVAGAGQYMRMNSAGTAFELRTMEQLRADLAASPGIVVFRNPGTTNWVVPSGVKRVWVEVYGAGGGVSSFENGSASAIMYSGGGGAYAANYFDVTPGASIPITVGAGGATNMDGAGTDGGSSSFGSLLTVGGGKACPSKLDGVAFGGYGGQATPIYMNGGRGFQAVVGGPEAKGGLAGGPLGGRSMGWFDDLSRWPGAGGAAQQINTTNRYATTAGGGAVIINW